MIQNDIDRRNRRRSDAVFRYLVDTCAGFGGLVVDADLGFADLPHPDGVDFRKEVSE